jgi:hypothetical protein
LTRTRPPTRESPVERAAGEELRQREVAVAGAGDEHVLRPVDQQRARHIVAAEVDEPQPAVAEGRIEHAVAAEAREDEISVAGAEQHDGVARHDRDRRGAVDAAAVEDGNAIAVEGRIGHAGGVVTHQHEIATEGAGDDHRGSRCGHGGRGR